MRDPVAAGAIDPTAVAAAEANMLSVGATRKAKHVLEALCDPTRLKIVRALSDTALAASDIARVIERSRAGTSQHLKVLRDVGAVTTARDGNVIRYRLSEAVAAEVLGDIGRVFDKLETGAA